MQMAVTHQMFPSDRFKGSELGRRGGRKAAGSLQRAAVVDDPAAHHCAEDLGCGRASKRR
jgi:hypothetical protein